MIGMLIKYGGNYSTSGFTNNSATSHTWQTGGYYRPFAMSPVKDNWEDMIVYLENIKKEDIPKMNIDASTSPKTFEKKYGVGCSNTVDLLPDRIIKNLSIMKSKLYFECAPYSVKRIECKMTPSVKNNIIMAYRKLNMYGKKTPFITCFDEYGRILEEQARIDTLQGMTITIVNPEDYGELYLEFTGVVIDCPF